MWQRQQCGGLVGNRLSRNGSPNNPVQSQKKPRRRVATIAQRRAANIRERRRMFNLNEAFDKLRRKVYVVESRIFRIKIIFQLTMSSKNITLFFWGKSGTWDNRKKI